MPLLANATTLHTHTHTQCPIYIPLQNIQTKKSLILYNKFARQPWGKLSYCFFNAIRDF